MKMGEAKQIIVFDSEKKLILKKDELQKILNQEYVRGLPIVIISMIGALRTGKSFLLSWLVLYFKDHLNQTSGWLNEESTSLSQFFKWRSGPEPETQGIWAWSEIFVVKGPSGENVGVLLIDTQGLFDKNITLKQNGNIFTLSTLISSIQIYNLSQKMQEDNLGNLQLFSEFGRLALNTEQNSTSSSFIKPFQRMIFLIRDWPNSKNYSYGSEGGRDYIEKYLGTGDECEEEELRERRKQIRQLFDQVDCYLMPHPGLRVSNDDDGDFDGNPSVMEQKFKDHLEQLPLFLFPEGAAVQSKLVAGAQIIAADLAEYVEIYVNLLNSDDNLSPKTMFQAMAKIRNNAVARNAKEEYKAYITAIEQESSETFLTDAEIQMKHSEAENKALEYFTQHQMGLDEESEIIQGFKKDISEELENWKSRNERTKAEILNINESALHGAEKIYSTTMEEWLKITVPFATFEQLNKQHQEAQETTNNDLNSHLKGTNEFKQSFKDRLHLFTQDHFLSVIVPKNESKEEEEKARSERIQLEAELEKERLEKEKAQKKASQMELAKEVVGLLRPFAEAGAKTAIESLESRRQQKDDYGPFGYIGSITYKMYRWMFRS